jgi:hypothetical protein
MTINIWWRSLRYLTKDFISGGGGVKSDQASEDLYEVPWQILRIFDRISLLWLSTNRWHKINPTLEAFFLNKHYIQRGIHCTKEWVAQCQLALVFKSSTQWNNLCVRNKLEADWHYYWVGNSYSTFLNSRIHNPTLKCEFEDHKQKEEKTCSLSAANQKTSFVFTAL